MIERPEPVGFVLGGGGSLGAGQVGMLRALRERDIRPALVVGTSVGSVNGALLALDPDEAPTRLAGIWQRMTRAKVFPGGPLTQLRTPRQYRNHLFPNTGLAEILRTELAGVDDFSNLRLPFGTVAVDAATGQAVLMTSGPPTPAILASSAIPGIYPPVHHDAHVLHDGGVIANVPIRQALALGAKSLVVLESERASAEVPVVYLPGAPVQAVTPLDFTHTAELISHSYHSSNDFLATLTINGPGLYGRP